MKDNELPTLGAVLIVKDEEERLGSILSDIHGVVDEIVVVDTGSKDRTVEVARSFNARVGFFDWCDDFSAARNRSIELARSDYLLWLDADDRIDAENRRKLGDLKGLLRPGRDRGYVCRVISREEGGSGTVALQARIFPNLEAVRFEGRVHEQILPSMERIGIRIASADLAIEHTGYGRDEAAGCKAARNLKILLDELAGGRRDAAHLFRIAMSCFALRDFAGCLEYLGLVSQQPGQDNLRMYARAVAAECHAATGRPEEALRELRQACRDFPGSSFLMYSAGALLFKLGMNDEALPLLAGAAEKGIEVENFPLPSDIRERAAWHLGQALEKAGRAGDAAEAYRASLKRNPDYVPALRALGLVLLGRGDVAGSTSCLERVKHANAAYDRPVWLCLARAYVHEGRFGDAHALYLESASKAPGDVEILTGLVQTGVEVNDPAAVGESLEALARLLGVKRAGPAAALPGVAVACAEIARGFLDAGDVLLAGRLADAAMRMDGSLASACLVRADVALASGNAGEALAHLERALLNGASTHVVEERVRRLEGK